MMSISSTSTINFHSLEGATISLVTMQQFLDRLDKGRGMANRLGHRVYTLLMIVIIVNRYFEHASDIV